jgi:hypothetical protein
MVLDVVPLSTIEKENVSFQQFPLVTGNNFASTIHTSKRNAFWMMLFYEAQAETTHKSYVAPIKLRFISFQMSKE